MKIAVFFIIMGISSCFGDGEETRVCKLNMDRTQAYHMGSVVIKMLNKYDKMTKSGKACDRWCQWEVTLHTAKMITAASGCDITDYAKLVVECLPEHWSSQAEKIKKIIEDEENNSLDQMGFISSEMVSTFNCIMDVLLSDEGYNPKVGLSGKYKGVVGSLSAFHRQQESRFKG